MHVVVSGATGLIGRALVLSLAGRGATVTAWVRDPARARRSLGADVALVPIGDDAALAHAVARADAVVHLAGEPIAAGRWTRARRRALHASRVDTAAALGAAIRRRDVELPVFVSASAVGIYGDRGDDLLPETAGAGAGFAADLCAAWERAAEAVPARRVASLRFGIVLSRGGGALAPLARLARLGLAGPVGGGAQWVPWVHVDDAVAAIAHAIATPTVRGPVNVVAPAPVRQRDLAAAIAAAVGRRARVPAPALAVRALLGEAASLVLASQRAVPAALERSGFRFAFPALAPALADLLADDRGVAIRRLHRGEAPRAPYLAARPPRYVLVARTTIERPLAEVAPFFAAAENLSSITPPELAFEIRTPTPIAMAAGTTIDYRIALGPVPMRWRTVIERWEPGALFVDAQHRGPYASWWHEHHFRGDGARTVMEDRVYYAPPLGPLGALANRLIVAPMLRRIFAFRGHAIRLRFAAPTAPGAAATAPGAAAAPPPRAAIAPAPAAAPGRAAT